MARSFRFVPPEPRTDLLTRPRLLRSLAGRWEHRVTSLVGGPGLGKTTLLAQAIAENRLAPRGDDVWIGVEEHDADADRLARVVATAMAGQTEDGDRAHRSAWDENGWDPAAVAGAVWHRAPIEACIFFDDVHLVPAGSTAATWLSDLVAAMPANGHLVLASRMEPPVPLTRLGTQGGVLRLQEEDLRFSDEELQGFAVRRGLDPERLDDTGGWPAMAELASSVGQRLTGAYLWEEILEPLGTVRRHVLAALSDLGGADDELISAAIGTPIDLADALDGVPLIARGADGWHVAHGLWRSAPGIALHPGERDHIRRCAVENLTQRGRHDEAFSLVQRAELWDAAPTVLRSACLAPDRLVPTHLRRWLADSPEPVRASTPGRLAVGIYSNFTSPAGAHGPLEEAWARATVEDDLEVEMAAIAHRAILAWWEQDLATATRVVPRVFELELTGHPLARAMGSIGRALLADLDGDDGTVVAELGGIEASVLDTVWEVCAGWLCGVAHLDLGDAAATQQIVDRLTSLGNPTMQHMVDGLQRRAWWRQGLVDEVMSDLPAVIADYERAATSYSRHLFFTVAAIFSAYVGDPATGRRYLDDALRSAPPSDDDRVSAIEATGTAALELAEGREVEAVATLRQAAGQWGLDQGQDRRAWRQVLALSYVLLPETRKHWDSLALRGYLRIARELAGAVVALRERQGDQRLLTLDVPSPGMVRAALPYPFAAELAVGLAAVGRSEGRVLLEALGPAGRAAVRAASTRAGSSEAKPARALLAAVPAPPPRPTYLAVLGPLEVWRDGFHGEEVVDQHLRRRRLHELVAFLVGHRRATRSAIIGALWPDLDERAAVNNLSVTLNHLLRVLEPWRDSGEPAYLLRLDGQTVQLVTGEHLHLDVDSFDEHSTLAASAEADGTPSLALEHHLAVTDLYRDDLHADLPEAAWFALDREHYRARFVSAAVRAGHLLLTRGDIEPAEGLAHRALAVDEWAEEAFTVLVGAALARRDRSGANRLLIRCFDALSDLGVEPSPTTLQLHRRLHPT
jgi:DNA-binding SARP family transcriptional activator